MKKRLRGLLLHSFILILAQLNISSVFADSSEFLKYDRNRGDIQGLYEVQKIAQQYVDKYNHKHKTHWVVGDPNFKILVYRCKVDPTVKDWIPKISKNNNIIVICNRTVSTRLKDWGPKWEIDLPVFQRKLK
jgi:hypothetical protein